MEPSSKKFRVVVSNGSRQSIRSVLVKVKYVQSPGSIVTGSFEMIPPPASSSELRKEMTVSADAGVVLVAEIPNFDLEVSFTDANDHRWIRPFGGKPLRLADEKSDETASPDSQIAQ